MVHDGSSENAMTPFRKITLCKIGFPGILLIWAVLTFIASLFGWFPSHFTEQWYARTIFPTISRGAGWFADLLPAAWLDVLIAGWVGGVIFCMTRQRYRTILGALAALYLMFFWTWGLNYHRTPLVEKLPLNAAAATGQNVEALTRRAAIMINRLYLRQPEPLLRKAPLAAEIASRMRKVVARIDGVSWPASQRVKHSIVLKLS